MKYLHLFAGMSPTSGVANIARRFARVQDGRGDRAVLLAPAFKWNPIYFGLAFALRAFGEARTADEIWVHCSWTFPVWYGAALARLFGKRLVVVPEGSFDPLRLHNRAGWKKRLAAPLDRWVLRRADAVLALCPNEVEWVLAFEPKAKVRFERVPIFPKDESVQAQVSTRKSDSPLRVLFLGRAEDPLKGVRYLTQAVGEVNGEQKKVGGESRWRVELRVVSGHVGAELEADWSWCDVLCLPTLSDNFGLVVAEALEHGKRVITTDGASAWRDLTARQGIYLKGFVSGSDEQRVRLLTEALTIAARSD